MRIDNSGGAFAIVCYGGGPRHHRQYTKNPAYEVDQRVLLAAGIGSRRIVTRGCGRSSNAKNSAKGYGTIAVGKTWCWYETWLNRVREECEQHPGTYRTAPAEATANLDVEEEAQVA
jgi:hypothetical protein